MGNKKQKLRMLSPSQYMRQKRPELFSDTKDVEKPIFDRGHFEYHLESLTSRKQEQLFEEFCRRLAELEICPNLKPQTGSTGGGDSKADASSYPISKILIERCYFGSPTPGTSELWGFAFSCKKSWSGKARDDVKKLAECERKYSKVYFISNQYARDKKRAKIENELSKEYGFEVHILDRNWIINKVFDNKRQKVAIEFLNIRIDERKVPEIGLNDRKRQSELDEVLNKLRNISKHQKSDYSIAKDYLWAAKLSRGLEKARHETEGLFKRAFDLAKKNQFKSLIIQCGYDYAWTSIWWFDDWELLQNIYDEIEPCLAGTYDAEECELFMNLLNLIYSGYKVGVIKCDEKTIIKRVKLVKDELKRLANDKERPNNALHATTLLYLVDLNEAIRESDKSKIVSTFKSLKKCLKKSNRMGTYPLKGFLYTLTEMGEFIGDLPGYDELFKEMRRIGSKRLSEVEDGEMLYRRGVQLIKKRDIKNALRTFGEASIKLSKEEARTVCVRSFLCCAESYTKMGLYWAARMETIHAAHMSVSKIELMDRYPVAGILSARKMCYLELTLGRISPFLAWYELGRGTLNYLKSTGLDFNKIERDFQGMDALLGCLMLNMNKQDVLSLKEIKPTLDAMELFASSGALSYVLGDVEQLLKEIPSDMAKNKKELDDLFKQWKEQPAAKEFRGHLQDQTADYLEYEIIIMNIILKFRIKNEVGLIYFAENLMGVVEAAFSLANWRNHAFIIEKITFVIDRNDSGQSPPDVKIKIEENDDVIELIWKGEVLEWMNNPNSKELTDCLKLVLFRILINFSIDPISEIKNELDQWHKEGTFDRALSRSPLKIPLTDLIGVKRYDINYWISKTSTP